MKLYLKQKVFSWRDRFFAVDENNAERYSVHGELLSWGKKLHIYDMAGTEAAFIREKVLTFLPRYFIEINNAVVCEIVKEFTFFRPKYRLEGMDLELDGDFWAHNYELNDKNGLNVMRISKKWFTWGDSYELDIPDPKNELLCLCVALAVDCALASSDNN